MDINSEQPLIFMENEDKEKEIKTLKRKIEENTDESNKKLKIEDEEGKITEMEKEQKLGGQTQTTTAEDSPNKELLASPQKMTPSCSKKKATEITNEINLKATVPQSPKKRLEVSSIANQNVNKNKFKDKFIYGNYSQYYGYRNKDKDFHDIRLDVFEEHGDIFRNKQILDIGCNSGFITMEVAKRFEIKSIVGLDIDKGLINQSLKILTKHKKSLPMENELKKAHKFPFNCSFVHGNYVLKDDVLLEIETSQFDVILCLSITKWIQLNFGDKGLKQAFKRMFLQLKPQGRLILEAQPYDNYGRRKKMTDTIFKNYKDMQFLPKDFTSYLLSPEVGFTNMKLMGVPDHCKKGFKRPIQIFFKE